MPRSLAAVPLLVVMWSFPTLCRAQIPFAVHGRVEDAVTHTPVAGARVTAVDSASTVVTDSLGRFVVGLQAGDSVAVRVERPGYLVQEFALGSEAASHLSILLLEPQPLELPGVDVVAETSVERVIRELHDKRNAFAGAVVAFDRTALERFALGGTAWDFVRLLVPSIFGCSSARSGLCLVGRTRTLTSSSRVTDGVQVGYVVPEDPVRVCIDGRDTWGATGELETLGTEDVSLVEVYSFGRIVSVYTPWYITAVASGRRHMSTFPRGLSC